MTATKKPTPTNEYGINGVHAYAQDCDIVYSPDDGGYYLQQWKHDGKGTTRTSEIYKAEADAMRAYDSAAVKWGEWS